MLRPPTPVLLLVGTLTAPAAGRAQLTVELGAGAVTSTKLARDSIVEAFSVGPAVAPVLDLAVETVLNPRYRLAVTVQWARSDLERRATGPDARVLSLTVWSGGLALRRRIVGGATVEATMGVIKYAASAAERAATLFRDDAPLLPTVGLGARVERGLGSRLTLGLRAGYALHRFSTQALRSDGFNGDRTVHRLSLSVSLRAHATR